MAATRLISMHANGKNSVAACLKARLDYSKNPNKTEQGLYVRTFCCDEATADAEFLLAKREYLQKTGRRRKSDVIAYQFRQSFKPGEISPAEANAVGYEFAERFLKGKHAFVVATHTDRKHIHNHIIWNSTNLNCDGKFRDFLGSGKAAGRLSNIICAEHHLSVIDNPNMIRHTKNPWAKEKKTTEQKKEQVSYLVDVEQKMKEGKGPGYEEWAKKYNLKQMAKTLNYLTEEDLLDYSKLEERAKEVSEIFDKLSDEFKACEKRMEEIVELRTEIINYMKTREIFAEYRKSGYSKKYLEAHESEILIHRNAKKVFDHLGLKKLPKVKDLNQEYRKILEKKKSAYAKYKAARSEMKEVLIAKSNIDQILRKEGRTEISKTRQRPGR